MKNFTLILTLLAGLFLATPAVYAQVPKLSSYPSASATLFLDFDGHTVTASAWNWSGSPIVAQAAALSSTAITEIYERVSEDYRPFNLNVTTDSAVYLAAPYNKRMRVIITPTSQWYGSAGGVAYVGSFTWGDDTPAWVFCALLGNNAKYVAEAVAHEAGHTLGLQHQSTYDGNCAKTAEYSAGTGSGEIGWAPIMGVGYYKNVTTWHNGPNTISCNNMQNDMAIIAGPANGFGYRADDITNNANSASNINIQSENFLVDGIVNGTSDIDAFKLTLAYGSNLTLHAVPENVGSNNSGANVDIRITILNSAKETVGSYNPSASLSAGLDTFLNSGTYYFMVDGVGNINHSNYGSQGYFSMAGALATILPLGDEKPTYVAPKKETQKKPVQILSNMVRSTLTVNSNDSYAYQLIDAMGRLVGKGMLQNGSNSINVSHATQGMLYFRSGNASAQWTEKLIKQ